MVDPSICLYITQIGTDRLEGVFSRVQTQDHARNCDILQLGQKSSIGAEVNRILEVYPELDWGHKKRDIKDSESEDHINPASVKANVAVGSVTLASEILGGRNNASSILDEVLGLIAQWNEMLEVDIDLCRPFGRYVGSHTANEKTNTEKKEKAGKSKTTESGKSGEARAKEVEESDDEDNDFEPQESTQPNPEGSIQSIEKAKEELEETTEEVLGAELDDDVNTLEANCTHSKFLSVDGKKYHKTTLCPKYLISPSSRKVVIRQFRAAGMTIKNITQCTTSGASHLHDDYLNISNEPSAASHIVNKDIGALLCHCQPANVIAAAVLEITHFRFGSGTASKIKFDIETKELESDWLYVVGQVLDFVYDPDCLNGRFVWTQKHAKLVQPITSSRNSPGQLGNELKLVSVPGTHFYPLRPGIRPGERADECTWTFTIEQLQKASTELWNFLKPDSDSILMNVDALPAFLTSQLPYRDKKGEEMFVVQEASSSTSKKRDGDSNVNCPLCGITLKLRSLHNHVGIHLLRTARGITDGTLTVATQVCTHS